MRTQRLLVLSLAGLALLAGNDARADLGRNPLAGQPAIRHRVEMRKLRFEVSPGLMLSINQPYLISIGGGLNLQFHINDWLGIAASFHYTGNVEAPIGSNIEGQLDKVYPMRSDPIYGRRQPTQQQFKDHLVGPQMLFAVYGTLTPIGGKFALFNSLFSFYDFYFMAGFAGAMLANPLSGGGPVHDCGAASVSNATCNIRAMGNDVNEQAPDPFTGFRPAGMFGIGLHLFFNQWIGLQFEVRDYIYKANPGGLDVVASDNGTGSINGKKVQGDKSPVLTSEDEYITSNLFFGLGVTILFPFKAQISR